MHLNEFADPKTYALSADFMAALIKQLEHTWLHRGLEEDSTDQPPDEEA